MSGKALLKCNTAMNHIYDTFIKKIEILSKAIEKATERTRSMLYIVTFFSLVILVTSFNAYLSWDRKLNAHERILSSEELDLIPSSLLKPYNRILADKLRASVIQSYQNITDSKVDSSIADIIYDLQTNHTSDTLLTNALDNYIRNVQSLLIAPSDYFKLYLDRQKFIIPIIGLSCYADDLYLIGGLGLVILLTYSFFSVRRENRIVERIANTINYIYNRDPEEYLDSHTYTATEIDLIKHNLLEYVFYGCVEFFIFNTGLTKVDYSAGKDKKSSSDRTNTLGRSVLSLIYFLPIFAMSFALFFEVKSFIDRYEYISKSDHLELYCRWALAAFFLFTNLYQSLIINQLNKTNSKLIDEMYDIIKISRKKLNLD